MSTILDALRKLERETAQRVQQPSSLSHMPLAEVLFKKRRRKAFRRMVITIALLFLAGAGTIITVGIRPFSSEDNVLLPKVAEAPKTDKEIKVSTVPVKQKEEVRQPPRVAKKRDSEPERLTKNEVLVTPPPRTEVAPTVLDKTLQKPAPELVKLIKNETPVTPPPRIETALTVPDKELQNPSPQIPSRPSSPIEPRRSETIIRDLELQAIVWSEDPGHCSAMINGSLVRLGGEIGGFTVEEIGQNYVNVKSGLRSGKLRMIGAR